MADPATEAARFIWRTFWRKARRHANGLTGPWPRSKHANLAALEALGGMAPVAVRTWYVRNAGGGAWPRLDLVLFKAWLLAGRPCGSWGAFKRTPGARAAALQKLAAQRRREVAHGR